MSAGSSMSGGFFGGSEPMGPPRGGGVPIGRSAGTGHVAYCWSHTSGQRPAPCAPPVTSGHTAAVLFPPRLLPACSCLCLPAQSPSEPTGLARGGVAGAAAALTLGLPEGRLGKCWGHGRLPE